MKVATITCSNAENYGARLQAYALARYIASMGHDVEVIDYRPEYMRFGTRLWYNPGLSLKEWAKLPLRFVQRRRDIAKHKALCAFMYRYVPLSSRTYGSVDELRLSPPEADVYVCGSDQIWNTDFPNGRDAAFYLDFGSPKVRRVSYAASFAIPQVAPQYSKDISRWLKGLDAVSVRESSAVDVAMGLGASAVQVCDPAFLLSSEQWRDIEEPIASDLPPYLLIYDFMLSDEIRQVAQRVAQARGLRIFSVSPRPLSYAHRNFCSCSPSQFVWLIRNARCVVSNSLHGSIFSMIFERDFFVVNRSDGLNLRMADMLRLFGLEGRIVSPSTPLAALCATIPYPELRQTLEAHIDASKSWLNRQFTFF